ncbi:extracellular solute-binding protein [Actinocorallia populi]|uniref:extracellular solute-binding protein n=1 Tax=Actinocorallia populi TaxID=2079200 RepID=UPI0013004665|nr:extracellular solute-binding protein [Actinocorallia populi]
MRQWKFAAGMLAGMLLVGVAALAVHRPWQGSGCPERRGGTLVVLGDKDVSSGRQRKAEIERWRGPGGTRAELRELSGVADLQHAQLAATAQDGGCGVDVYILDGPWVAEFAEAGHLAPLEGGGERLDGLLTGELRESGYHDGELWAVPFSAEAPLLYYRKDLLEKADLEPPESWDEVWEHSRTLLADPSSGLRAGYAAQLAHYEGFTINVLELMWMHDRSELLDDDGEVEINTIALQEIREKFDDPRLIARESFTWHEDEATRAFVEGETLFLRNWPTAYRKLAEDPSAENAGRLTEKYGVTVLPRNGVLGGQSLAVAANSPYKAEARRLIEALTGYGAQNRLFWCGGFAPVHAGVYDRRSPEACDAGASDDEGGYVAQLPPEELDTLRAAVEQARPRPNTPYYTEFSRVFQEVLYCDLQPEARVTSCPQKPGSAPEFLPDLEKRLTDALRGR